MKYQKYNNISNFALIFLMIMLFSGGFGLVLGLFGAILAVIFNFFPMILIVFFLSVLFRSIKKNQQINSYLDLTGEAHQHFMELMVRMAVIVIQADQKIDAREIDSVIAFYKIKLKYAGNKLIWVSDLVQKALRQNYSLEYLCTEMAHTFPYEARLILLDLLYEVAISDKEITQPESDIIEKTVTLLSITRADHERIRARFIDVLDNELIHYKILGVAYNASDEEIKRAYKTACKKYHPDKVYYLGDEFRKIAENQMVEINKAYDALIKNKRTTANAEH